MRLDDRRHSCMFPYDALKAAGFRFNKEMAAALAVVLAEAIPPGTNAPPRAALFGNGASARGAFEALSGQSWPGRVEACFDRTNVPGGRWFRTPESLRMEEDFNVLLVCVHPDHFPDIEQTVLPRLNPACALVYLFAPNPLDKPFAHLSPLFPPVVLATMGGLGPFESLLSTALSWFGYIRADVWPGRLDALQRVGTLQYLAMPLTPWEFTESGLDAAGARVVISLIDEKEMFSGRLRAFTSAFPSLLDPADQCPETLGRMNSPVSFSWGSRRVDWAGPQAMIETVSKWQTHPACLSVRIDSDAEDLLVGAVGSVLDGLGLPLDKESLSLALKS